MSDDNNVEPARDELVFGGPQGAPTRRKRWWVGGLALCVTGAGVGAAAWAAVSFFGTGEQPAEALPDSTVGYVSIDLDPSGGQKIEALKLARKFPAFKEKVGLGTDDDLRQWLVEQIAGQNGCDLDYAADVEPWLGSRAALAAVGTDKPFPVLVVQTTDAAKADAGLKKLTACDPGTDYAWKTSGDWTVLAETQGEVDQVVADAGKGSLADDKSFQDWTARVGDSGLMTAYAAPAVGGLLADELSSSMHQMAGGSGCGDYTAKVKSSLAHFKGAAATLKLNGGGVDLSAVADAGVQSLTGLAGQAHPAGTPAITTLPSDTAAAYGVAMPAGWAARWQKALSTACGVDSGKVFGELSDTLGFDLLQDGPAVFGNSLAIALGSDIDVEGLVNGGDPSKLPIALKTTGDKEAVDKLLGSLTSKLGMSDGYLETRGGKGSVAVALDGDYAQKVAGDGGLGKDATFRDVVPHAGDASAVVYVNFNRLDDAVAQAASGDKDVIANLKPLEAAGFSVWNEDGDLHTLLRVTLD